MYNNSSKNANDSAAGVTDPKKREVGIEDEDEVLDS